MTEEKRTCINCRRAFFPAVPSQDECSSCMVSPSRKSSTYNDFQIEDDGVTITPTIDQETPMTMKLPPKQCPDCKQLYEPSSNRQIRCPTCRDKAEARPPKLSDPQPEPQKATKMHTEPVVPVQSQEPTEGPINHYEAALELVRELLANEWRVTATKDGIKLTVEVEK